MNIHHNFFFFFYIEHLSAPHEVHLFGRGDGRWDGPFYSPGVAGFLVDIHLEVLVVPQETATFLVHCIPGWVTLRQQQLNNNNNTFNSLWPRSGSTLAQVMACCLMAPSHYQNRCWLIITKVLLHSSNGNFTSSVTKINMKITHLKCH